MMKSVHRLYISKLWLTPHRKLSVSSNLRCSRLPELSDKPLFEQSNEKILKKRNKSRLNDYYYSIENNRCPPTTHMKKVLKSHLQKCYGHYGAESGVDPIICWPDKETLRDEIEIESMKYPNTLQEMMAIERQKEKEANEALERRKEEILKNLKQVEEWKRKVAVKTKQKEEIYNKIAEKRQRTLEEVREFFGYRIDPRDPRFKEMVARKEEEEKKKRKEEKKQEKQAKMLAKLTQMADKSLKQLEEHKSKDLKKKTEEKT